MPSHRETRVWIMASVTLLWMGLSWAIWDWSTQVPLDTPEAVLRHVQKTTAEITWATIGVMGFAALAMTRLASCVLRAHRDSGQAANG